MVENTYILEETPTFQKEVCMADTNIATITQLLKRGQEDIIWFSNNLNDFKKKFDGKFIAFSNKEIIDNDSSFDVLLARLRKKNIDISSVFIKFVSKIKLLL